jgi:hypothetical protein
MALKDSAIGLIVIGTITAVVGPYIYDNYFKKPETAKRPDAVSRQIDLPASKETSRVEKSEDVAQPVSTTSSNSFTKYLHLGAGAQIPAVLLAVDADEEMSIDVRRSAAADGINTAMNSTFVSDGSFKRVLNGDGQLVEQLGFPSQVKRILMVSVGAPQRTGVDGLPTAIRSTRPSKAAVVDAQTGRVLQLSQFDVVGLAYSEDQLQSTARESLSKSLLAVTAKLATDL